MNQQLILIAAQRLNGRNGSQLTPAALLKTQHLHRTSIATRGDRIHQWGAERQGTTIRQAHIPGTRMRRRNIRRRLMLQQVIGILRARHTQTNARGNIGANILRNSTLGTLSRQHQVQAQRAANRGDAHQLSHSVRHGIDEHAELVHHDQQLGIARSGTRRLAGRQVVAVGVHAERLQIHLAAVNICAQKFERTLHLGHIKIAQHAERMR